MKAKFELNHEAKTVTEALGLDEKVLDKKAKAVRQNYIQKLILGVRGPQEGLSRVEIATIILKHADNVEEFAALCMITKKG